MLLVQEFFISSVIIIARSYHKTVHVCATSLLMFLQTTVGCVRNWWTFIERKGREVNKRQRTG